MKKRATQKDENREKELAKSDEIMSQTIIKWKEKRKKKLKAEMKKTGKVKKSKY